MVRLNARRRKAAAAVEPVAVTDLTIQASPYQIDLSGSLRTDYGRLQAGLFAVCAALHPGAQKTLAVVYDLRPPPPPGTPPSAVSPPGPCSSAKPVLLTSTQQPTAYAPAAGRRTDVSRV